MPQISKQGRTVMAGDKPLKTLPTVDVDENIVVIRQDAPNSWVEQGWTLVYFMDSKESADMMKQGKMDYLLVPPSNLRLAFAGRNPITDVWKKKFAVKGSEHILGLLQANSMPDEIYLDMMTVRKKYQKSSINSKMIETLRKRFPNAKFSYSQPTDDGKAFIAKRPDLMGNTDAQEANAPENKLEPRKIIKLTGNFHEYDTPEDMGDDEIED